MFKKLVGVLLILVMISMCGLSVFADPTDNSAPGDTGKQDSTVDNSVKDAPKVSVDDILNKALEEGTENSKTIVTISKPSDGKDSTYKKTYVISGVTDYENVMLVFAKYDSENKKYVPLKDEDGNFKWEVGSFGAFAREIKLSKGANKIRILAYRKPPKADELTIDDVQIKDLTITLLDETIKEKIMNTFVDIQKAITDILKPK